MYILPNRRYTTCLCSKLKQVPWLPETMIGSVMNNRSYMIWIERNIQYAYRFDSNKYTSISRNNNSWSKICIISYASQGEKKYYLGKKNCSYYSFHQEKRIQNHLLHPGNYVFWKHP